jgi:hypothetical protein
MPSQLGRSCRVKRGREVDRIHHGAYDADILRPTADALGRAISPYLIAPAQFREKRHSAHHFVARVLAGPKVDLIGHARRAGAAR